MHVLWTPSWYPSADAPLNGSFFVEQQRMLTSRNIRVGTAVLQARSINELHNLSRRGKLEGSVVRQDFPLIPRELLPFDPHIIASYAQRAGRFYAQHHGIPDIIHAHSVFPGVLAAQALSRMWNIPFGMTEHRPSSLERSPQSPRGRAIMSAMKDSAFNITVSTDMAEKLGAYYSLPTFVAQPLPAPDAFFEAPLHRFHADTFTFMHVSHMDRNKRVEETLSAFAEVARTHPHARLRLIGGTPERCSELQHDAASQGILDQVDIVGAVSREAILDHMLQGDCLVLVSEFEAGGTVFAEAQALGIPIIASATPAGKFMTTETTGLLVPIDDHHALVQAMVTTIDRVHRGQTHPEKIRNFARSRSSESVFARTLIDLYSKAINR